MWDEQRDKEMRRNQISAIVVMTALLLAWYFFFVPSVPPPPLEQPTTQPGVQSQAAPGAESLEAADETVAEAATRAEAWPYLPPIPDQPDPVADEVRIGDEHLDLVFTKVGGRLKRASVVLGEDGKDSLQLIPQWAEFKDADVPYPMGLRSLDPALGEQLNRRRFEAEVAPSGRSVTFSLALPNAFTVRKQFTISDDAHVLDVTIEFENTSPAPTVFGMDTFPAFTLDWGPDMRTGPEDSQANGHSVVWHKEVDGQPVSETLALKSLPPPTSAWESAKIGNVDWLGFKTKYFLVAFEATGKKADGWAAGIPGEITFGLASPRFEVAPGMTHADAFRVYIGPMELKSLDEAWPTLSTALTFFTMFDIMDWFAKALLSVLHWFYHNTIPNYGIAIILLTVLVRTAVFPLTLKSMRSMKKMQQLAPELKELQEKYKDDQQELSKKMMEMYRERGVNPLSGCFPMLIQMPVFFALYRMLWNAFELRGAPFLWVNDLSKPDQLFHMPFMTAVPFLGQYLEYLNLLPLLMGAALVINMKVMPSTPMQNPQQKMMMTIMPIMFTVFCYSLAAGLNLYVLTSTILGMAQQLIINKTGSQTIEPPTESKRPKKKKQHFYARAQEMKRQVAKDAKKNKQNNKPASEPKRKQNKASK